MDQAFYTVQLPIYTAHCVWNTNIALLKEAYNIHALLETQTNIYNHVCGCVMQW